MNLAFAPIRKKGIGAPTGKPCISDRRYALSRRLLSRAEPQKVKKATENKSVFQGWAQKVKKATENKSVFQSCAKKVKKATENKSVFQSCAHKVKKAT